MAADMAHGGREWEEVCVETFHLSKALEKPFLNLASRQSTYSWCHLETWFSSLAALLRLLTKSSA